MALTSIDAKMEVEINSFFPASVTQIKQVVGSIIYFDCVNKKGIKFAFSIQYCLWSLVFDSNIIINSDGSIDENTHILIKYIGKKIKRVYFNNDYTTKIVIDDGSYFMCEDDSEFYGEDASMVALLAEHLNYVFTVKDGLFTRE